HAGGRVGLRIHPASDQGGRRSRRAVAWRAAAVVARALRAAGELKALPVVLETQTLEKHFGGIAAVAGVSLKVEKGARHALIGPNGAGKTTVINLLTGVLRPSAGRILLEGQDITALEAYKRVQRGLARTFQI